MAQTFTPYRKPHKISVEEVMSWPSRHLLAAQSTAGVGGKQFFACVSGDEAFYEVDVRGKTMFKGKLAEAVAFYNDVVI